MDPLPHLRYRQLGIMIIIQHAKGCLKVLGDFKDAGFLFVKNP